MNPLKLKRLERGLTQYALSYGASAHGANISPSYISLWEKGYPVLKLHHKKAIADFLGVKNVKELFPSD